MTNVVGFPGNTLKDIDVDDMLESNKKQFDTLVFAGWDKKGEFQCGGSTSDIAKVILLLELFKKEMLEGV